MPKQSRSEKIADKRIEQICHALSNTEEPYMSKATLKIDVWTSPDQEPLPDDAGDLSEMLAEQVEHVARLCREGYTSGQIYEENRFSGWWTIERK